VSPSGGKVHVEISQNIPDLARHRDGYLRHCGRAALPMRIVPSTRGGVTCQEHVALNRRCPCAARHAVAIRCDLDVLSLPDLVSIYDLVGRHLLAGALIDLAIPDAAARLAIDLMEADFVAFARRREERNWTGYKRKAQIAFPVSTGGHGTFLADNHSTPLLLKPFRDDDQAVAMPALFA
jgi:hypothetical protein